MIFREASLSDIPQMHVVRMSVKENALTNPELVKEKDYEEFITTRGKGWVCEKDNTIIGFSIVDMQEKNVWALFIHPDFERLGVGRRLHQIMMKWYFSQCNNTIWLGTAPKTRAELFYRKAGWHDKGIRPNGEIRFEMNFTEWHNR